MSQSKIKLVVQPVHMGLGHDGLAKFLKSHAKIDVKGLQDGDLIMCINSRANRLKVIGGKGLVVGYLKMPNEERIMQEALQYIPRTFGAGGFDYDAACKKALEERFKLPSHRPKGPLEIARAKRVAGV